MVGSAGLGKQIKGNTQLLPRIKKLPVILAGYFGWCLLLLLGGGIWLTRGYYIRGTRSFAELETPLIIPGMLIPIGLFVLFLQFVAEIYKRFR